MNRKNIHIAWRQKPQKYDSIRIETTSSHVLNYLCDSLDEKPITFTFGIENEYYIVTDIDFTDSEDKTSRNLNFQVELIEDFNKENFTNQKEIRTKFNELDMVLKDIGKDKSHICIPRNEYEFDDFLNKLVKRVTELWPNTKRQARTYLGIPEYGTFDDVHKIRLRCEPEKFMKLCYLEFPCLGEIVSYSFGNPELLIESHLSANHFLPDFNIPFWEFFVISADCLPNEGESNCGKVKIRGLRNIAVKIIVIEEKDGILNVKLTINRDLPIRPFIPGDKTKIRGEQDLVFLNFPFEEQVNQFIETIKDYQEIFRNNSSLHNKSVKRKKPGRPHYPEDVWAWKEVFENGRDKKDVYPDWLEKVMKNPKRKNNVANERQYKRIMKPDWL